MPNIGKCYPGYIIYKNDSIQESDEDGIRKELHKNLRKIKRILIPDMENPEKCYIPVLPSDRLLFDKMSGSIVIANHIADYEISEYSHSSVLREYHTESLYEFINWIHTIFRVKGFESVVTRLDDAYPGQADSFLRIDALDIRLKRNGTKLFHKHADSNALIETYRQCVENGDFSILEESDSIENSCADLLHQYFIEDIESSKMIHTDFKFDFYRVSNYNVYVKLTEKEAGLFKNLGTNYVQINLYHTADNDRMTIWERSDEDLHRFVLNEFLDGVSGINAETYEMSCLNRQDYFDVFLYLPLFVSYIQFCYQIFYYETTEFSRIHIAFGFYDAPALRNPKAILTERDRYTWKRMLRILKKLKRKDKEK